MNVKKKLIGGAMSAVMGLSLVGGGTFAAFNDVEKTTAKVGAGKFDLVIKDQNGGNVITNLFEISNMKPGDYQEREFSLYNHGTLAIKDVLMSIDFSEFKDYGFTAGYTELNKGKVHGQNTHMEFLDQIELSVVSLGTEGGNQYSRDIVTSEKKITLADVYKATNASYSGSDKTAAQLKLSTAIESGYYIDNRINMTTIAKHSPDKQWVGIPASPEDFDKVKIKLTFKDDQKKTAGLYDQNKFNGDMIKVKFEFEGRQWHGQEVTPSDQDSNGYIKSNEKANNGDPFQ